MCAWFVQLLRCPVFPLYNISWLASCWLHPIVWWLYVDSVSFFPHKLYINSLLNKPVVHEPSTCTRPPDPKLSCLLYLLIWSSSPRSGSRVVPHQSFFHSLRSAGCSSVSWTWGGQATKGTQVLGEVLVATCSPWGWTWQLLLHGNSNRVWGSTWEVVELTAL